MSCTVRPFWRGPLKVTPTIVGAACCIVSALCYTAANICLRQLAELKIDEMWVVCNKEVVTVLVVGPWLIVQALRGSTVIPPRRALLALASAGLAVQLCGNLSVQWAFSVVGIAIVVPVVFGVMLSVSATLGWVLLNEAVSARSITALGLLICSIILLSVGAALTETASTGTASTGTASTGTASTGTASTDDLAAHAADVPSDPAVKNQNERRVGLSWMLLGVGAGCVTGAVYALLGITIRFTATAHVPVASIAFVITSMGVLSLGTLSLWRLGPARLLATEPEHFAWMMAAGTFNLIALLAIVKGLQLISVVHANVLNASQVAMSALAGVLLFHESLNGWCMLGIYLTIVGLVLFRPPEPEEPDLEAV